MELEDILNKRIVVHGITGQATIRVTWCDKSEEEALKNVNIALKGISGITVQTIEVVNVVDAFEFDKDGTPYKDFILDINIKMNNPGECVRTGVIQSELEVYHRFCNSKK